MEKSILLAALILNSFASASACTIFLNGRTDVAKDTLTKLGYNVVSDDSTADLIVSYISEDRDNRKKTFISATSSDGTVSTKILNSCHHGAGRECQVMYRSLEAKEAAVVKKTIKLVNTLNCE